MLTLNIRPCSSVSIVNFELVNAGWDIGLVRSNHSQTFYKTGVLKNFGNFSGKYLCRNLFLKKLQHRCFPVKFANFLGTHFLIEHIRCLLLFDHPITFFRYNCLLKLFIKYFFQTLCLNSRQTSVFEFAFFKTLSEFKEEFEVFGGSPIISFPCYSSFRT